LSVLWSIDDEGYLGSFARCYQLENASKPFRCVSSQAVARDTQPVLEHSSDSILLTSVSYRDVAVMTIRLQQGNSRNHRCDNQHIGERVRQHLLHDLFGLLPKVLVRNQCPGLLFRRGMTAEKLYSPKL
jgi:hypothetical protein